MNTPDFFISLLFVVEIGPGVRHIMSVATPRGNALITEGECFIRRRQREFLGVGWDFSLFGVRFFLRRGQ